MKKILAHLMFYIISLIAGLLIWGFIGYIYDTICNYQRVYQDIIESSDKIFDMSIIINAVLGILITTSTILSIGMILTFIPYVIIITLLKSIKDTVSPIDYMIGGGITASFLPFFMLNLVSLMIEQNTPQNSTHNSYLIFIWLFFSGLCAGYIYYKLEFRKKEKSINI